MLHVSMLHRPSCAHLPHARVPPEHTAHIPDGPQAIGHKEVLEECFADAPGIQAQADIATASQGRGEGGEGPN